MAVALLLVALRVAVAGTVLPQTLTQTIVEAVTTLWVVAASVVVAWTVVVV